MWITAPSTVGYSAMPLKWKNDFAIAGGDQGYLEAGKLMKLASRSKASGRTYTVQLSPTRTPLTSTCRELAMRRRQSAFQEKLWVHSSSGRSPV